MHKLVTGSHHRLRQSSQMVGGSLSWQAGRRTDPGLTFRQSGLASFVGCSSSGLSLAMCATYPLVGPDIWSCAPWCSSRLSSSCQQKTHTERISSCILFPHAVEMKTVAFVPVWCYGKPPCRSLCDQPSPQRESPDTHITQAALSVSPSGVISKPQLGARLPEGSRQALQGHQGWQNCNRSPHDLEMKVERKPLGVWTAQIWEHLSGLLSAGRESLSCTDCFNKTIFTMLSYLLSHWNYKIVAVPEKWEL